VQMNEDDPPFPPYDDALLAFEERFSPGCEAKIILSPRKVLNQFKHEFPSKPADDLCFRGIPVKLAENQVSVSVRGTSSGYHCEWPEPSDA